MGKRLRAWITKNEKLLRKYRYPLAGIALISILLLAFFGTKFALYVNLLLGNDIVVRLDTSVHEIGTKNNDLTPVTFTASIITNPFCLAQCTATFADASENRTLAEESFTLSTGDPFERTYEIVTPSEGEGIALYHYRIACTSTPRALCQTEGLTTRRTALVTNEYTLSATQASYKVQARTILEEVASRIANLKGQEEANEQAVRELARIHTLVVPNPSSERSVIDAQYARLRATWQAQQFSTIITLANETRTMLTREEERMAKRSESIDDAVARHNQMILALNETAALIARASATPLLDATMAGEIDNLTRQYNAAIGALQAQASLEDHEEIVSALTQETANITPLFAQRQAEQKFGAIIDADLTLDTLCEATNTCIAHPNITQRISDVITPQQACDALALARQHILTLNGSTNLSDENASIEINRTRKSILTMYGVHAGEGWQRALLEARANTIPLRTEMTSASETQIVAELTRTLAGACERTPLQLLPRENILRTIEQPQPNQGEQPALAEPQARCCVSGLCTACGTYGPAQAYPILLVHGHAFNKDTLAEYSFDALGQIQEQLENDGYLDAGAISARTNRDTLATLARVPAPVTFRATYYLDAFKDEHDEVLVQAKSESIDTYALRLGEVIEHVRARTGKDKVIIVAHSMGGLVSRRYAQIFGSEHLAGIIMIGTPNHGLEPEELRWCNLIGEDLECRDMDSSSLFLNKLNREPQQVPMHVIIGSGCEMREHDGDGVVTVESASLEGAQQTIIEGSCSGISTLHTRLLDTTAHPQVYAILQETLAKFERS